MKTQEVSVGLVGMLSFELTGTFYYVIRILLPQIVICCDIQHLHHHRRRRLNYHHLSCPKTLLSP